MSDNVYVVSTMTAAVKYAFWKTVDGMPFLKDYVVIAGGAGIPSLKSGFGDQAATTDNRPLWTAKGVVTPVPREKFELLREHPVFKKHLKAGRLEIVDHDITGNHKAVKKIAAGMENGDKSSLLTPETFKTRVKVSVKTVETETGFRL